ncbi:hypothetical protein KY290_024709 [Solanum tuberosum]|uniref:RNase H type-1 domain-containing protein n=1 Tax=Solanum tuberosum TaxID=4113 RepID=A0ABQ7URG9_SOLTU|nr:hypothetical protein KY284_023563 [Solanum tuberosum]KAH0754439.1 hypothetical protein KY290_024709 [Solanum tuberosum]
MNRPSIAEVLESWEQRCRLKIVSWIHPLDGWYKCNVDNASKGNPDLVKGRRHPVSTNLFAEAVTIKEGIQLSLDRNLLPFIVETDSLTMINILKERWGDLPMRSKKLINMDKISMPHLSLAHMDC